MTGEKKRRKGKAKTARTLEQVALDAFAATGDVSGLGVLADWVDEFQPERGEFAAQLREVMAGTIGADAVRFFWSQGGTSYDPTTETMEQGRFRGACELAAAEEWLTTRCGSEWGGYEVGDLIVRWEQDDDYSADDYEPETMPQIAWVCLIQRFESRARFTGREVWHTLASLGAVTFDGDGYPDGNPYKRVVEAELASEAMG
jgi:hypothetical protein